MFFSVYFLCCLKVLFIQINLVYDTSIWIIMLKKIHLSWGTTNMLENNKNSLLEMYKSLSEEADDLNKKIEVNLSRISEIDEYLNYVYHHEDKDFKIFSPRDVDSIYKDNLDDYKTDKYKLENDNRILYSRLNKLNSYIECLKETVISKNDGKNLKVLVIQEKERQRIARDLHDTSLQNLSYLVHKIELASLYIDKDKIQAKLELETVSKSIKVVIDEIRNTVFNLRPMHFDDLGLTETMNDLFVKLKASNPSFDFDTHINYIDCSNDIILMTIYRVVQEACENAVKHSNGNKVHVVIEQSNNKCNILIEDNGCGFDVDEVCKLNEKHYGIEILKERVMLLGGNIHYHSVINKGTEIKIQVPLI